MTESFHSQICFNIYYPYKFILLKNWIWGICGGGGRGGEMVVEPLTKFSKRGALTRSQFLEEVARKKESEFFQGVAVFT